MSAMKFSRPGPKAAGTALAGSRIPDIPFSALPREISRKLRGAAALTDELSRVWICSAI